MKTSKDILQELKASLSGNDYLIVESAFKIYDEFMSQWERIFPTELELKLFALREQKKLKNAVKDIEPFIRIANLVCKVFKEKMINIDGELPTVQELIIGGIGLGLMIEKFFVISAKM